MSVRRHLAGTLAVPLLVVALTACGGGDDSVADPPISSPPTSSPTQAPHRESAEHFIRRWAAEDIRMQNSGDTGSFRKLSRGCRDCVALADRVDRIYGAGGYIHAEGWSIRQVKVVSRDGARLIVNLRVVSRPTDYRETSDGLRKSYPGGPATYQLGVKPTAHDWRVVSLGRLG